MPDEAIAGIVSGLVVGLFSLAGVWFTLKHYAREARRNYVHSLNSAKCDRLRDAYGDFLDAAHVVQAVAAELSSTRKGDTVEQRDKRLSRELAKIVPNLRNAWIRLKLELDTQAIIQISDDIWNGYDRYRNCLATNAVSPGTCSPAEIEAERQKIDDGVIQPEQAAREHIASLEKLC